MFIRVGSDPFVGLEITLDHSLFNFNYLFLVELGFELRTSRLQSRSLLIEPHLRSSFALLFWRWGLKLLFARLT
jgi:hypothetical protein